MREIDAQHRELVDILNRLHEAVLGGESKKALEGILAELVHHTQMHFASEEQLMQTHGFPRLAGHKIEHKQLTDRVVKFQEELNAGRITLGLEMLTSLKHWLSNHIMSTDQQYGAYIANRVTAANWHPGTRTQPSA
jgi:hemerythrin